MPRKAAIKVPALLSRDEVAGLCQRFLKEGKYDGKRDPMIMYRIIKKFPARDFWMDYELGFKLNALFWFLGKDGQERLKKDWDIFLLDIPAPDAYPLEENKVGQDVEINRKPKTVAELLK